MNGKRASIAVTGATGYLGGRVIARLREIGLDMIACPSRADGLDLTDRDAVAEFFAARRFETVIHCAAVVPKMPKDYADDAAGAASLAMTMNLLAAGVSHIVFASSMTVYGIGARMPVREEDASDNLSGYAGFKRRAERALCDAPSSVATILRLPGLFGPPRTGGLLYNVAASLARGAAPSLADTPPLWAALHVDDAAELLVRAAAAPARKTRILNAGYAAPMSVTLTVAQLAALFGIALPTGDAPVFQMDVSRLDRVLGGPSKTLGERLAELAAAPRAAQELTCA